MANEDTQKMLDKLKRKRSTVKSITTKLLNKINELLSQVDLNADEVEDAQEQLIIKEKQLLELDKQIEDGTDDLDQLQQEIENNQEYFDRIVLAKSKIKRCLKRLSEVGKGENKGPELSVSSSKNLAASSEPKFQVRLPKIIIEKFDGDNWLEFWSQFKTTIHDNDNLTKIEKFSYLKGLLRGSAFVAVQGLLISENNYDKSIQILTERYGKKDILIRSHINKLLNLPPVRHVTHLKELRNLYDTCEIQIRSLESLDVELKSYGNLLFPMVTKLMPDSLILEYNRTSKTESESWDVSNLLQFLKTEIENREKTFSFRKGGETERSTAQFGDKISHQKYNNREYYPKYEIHDKRSINKFHNVPSATALGTPVSNDCLFCSENHNLESCPKTILERKEVLKRDGRCYLCLKKYHRIGSCTSKIRCKNCSRKHNSSICEHNAKKETETDTEAIVSSVQNLKSVNEIYLQTANASICGGHKNMKLRILLDLGSQRSFILESVAKRLKLESIGEENVTIHSFGSNKPVSQKRKRYRVTLKNSRVSDKGIEIEVLETPKITDALIAIPDEEVQNYCRKHELNLADITNNKSSHLELSILIGSDHYWKVVSGKVHRLSNSLVASETLFGWTINGTAISWNTLTEQSSVNVMKATVSITDTSICEVNKIIRKFWDLEALGIIEDKENDELENKIVENFNNTIRFHENRYEVKLPWNERVEELKNNYSLAMNRLNGLARKFSKSPEFYKSYAKVVEDHLERGIAEEVNVDESNTNLYYMPHQAVIRKDKTTYLRVVYDASSHVRDAASLNDCLHPGPNLNPNLIEILIQFRDHKIALTADIEQAFLQISLSVEDRDAVRFLWANGLINEREFEVKALRMTRVIFGATSSPFLLAATIKHHINKFKEDYVKAYTLLNECLYVDDLIAGDEDENEALQIHEDVRNILNKANFNMRKWITNSPGLQRVFNKNEKIDTNNITEQKVLGYNWNPKEDVIKIELHGLNSQIERNENITKREVLKCIGRIYDPIGFLNPFTVTAKIIMQEIWLTGLEWDLPLPLDLQQRWRNWCSQIHSIGSLKVPRHYFDGNNRNNVKDVQLHCFTDASMKAYGAVIYLKYTKNDGSKSSNFVISKTRVSPIKKLSLPRLELMAAVIGTRLITKIQEQLSKRHELKLYLWTDSTATLHWIKGDCKKWKPFVQNRVMDIQGKTSPSAWNYCPGVENPADILTRGERVETLESNKVWWHGPRWLVEDEKSWPKMRPSTLMEEVKNEQKRGFEKDDILQTNCTVTTEKSILNLSKFSNLRKLLRITAWILRFVNNVKPIITKRRGALSTDELQEAEKYWIKKTQEGYFPEEIKGLRQNKAVCANSRIIYFKPFLDEEQIIRVGGRLQSAELSFSEMHPVILPSSNHFSDLQILEAHRKVGHGGIAETLAQVRERLWILKGRQRVKSVINKCFLCRRFKAKPFCQDVAPLPLSRVREALPFEVSGVDFAGPLYTKNNGKAYIVLFTCGVTRAVHLELVTDLTTSKFLLAFQRFISRRGICKYIYSDNAKTFKKASEDIKRLWQLIEKPEVQDYFGKNAIQWRFIVERAAWWGGFWERLVRSTKTCLKKILGKTSLEYEELETVLIEVEAILNSRPLTYVYNEVDEPGPLCPGHFLIGKRLTSLPPDKVKIGSSSKQELTRKYKYKLTLLERLWKIWKEHYLMELKSAHTAMKTKCPQEIKKDSVVLIYEDKQPRHMWKLGVITETHQGRDNKIRACTVRLPNGTILKRAIQHLYSLELDLETERPDTGLSGPEDVANATRNSLVPGEGHKIHGP